MTTNLRSRYLHFPYGDQALFLRRAYFEELGGFPAMPIMEDYELVRRLRQYGRIITLRQRVRTSARRWMKKGVLKTTLINSAIVMGYHMGIPTERLARWYRGSPGSGTAMNP
jgi:GT2 family glycosyltransferase